MYSCKIVAWKSQRDKQMNDDIALVLIDKYGTAGLKRVGIKTVVSTIISTGTYTTTVVYRCIW